MSQLKNRVAIVTGSSRGIGKGIALGLAKSGAHIVVNCEAGEDSANEVAALVEECGVGSLVVIGDVSLREDVARLVAATMDKFGRIDVLVNDAAVFYEGPFLEMSDADWSRVLDVNLKGVFLCSQAVGRVMQDQKSGVIINISSLGSQVVVPNMAAYCASKGAVNTLTRAVALELAPFGVRVNAVAPGHIDTAGNVALVEGSAERRERYFSRVAFGRLGRIEEIANMVVFLASDECPYLTGQTLYIEGGLMMWQGPL